MFRIGIDFDNTIACYDQAFQDVATMMGLIAPDGVPSKIDIKARVLSRPNGEIDWQRLQGQVYGKYMLRAQVFPGFHEFLYLSRLRGHRVFIVSHKSEFGHFDEERVPLRDQALLWLQENGFFAGDGLALNREDVFFESTREDKLGRIRHLECTHFIDDLREVFDEPLFPGAAKKVLFSPGANGDRRDDSSSLSSTSWRDLTHRLHGTWTEEEICRVVQAKFPSLGVKHVALRKGRGNSKVYELAGGSRGSYALKIYPDRQHDTRRRLETEFSACRELLGLGYPVADAIAKDANLGWGIYRWVAGLHIEKPDRTYVAEATKFIRRLYEDSRSIDGLNQFSEASEACLSGAEIVRQLNFRMTKLMESQSEELTDFLKNAFLPCFTRVVRSAEQKCSGFFETLLPRSLQILNPSDFGSHNALRGEDGRITFIDFEYFGWDEPVKMASDFYWHPGMELTSALRKQWVESVLEIFQKDHLFSLRLTSYLPLYGLRWCLILLNEYLQQRVANRLHADPMKSYDLASVRRAQLQKSRMLLKEIEESSS